MRPQRNKPAIYSRKAKGLTLSGHALIELMQIVLDKGVPFRFAAKGFSMSPFIRDGDVITISPLSSNAPRLGDVVAYIRPKVRKMVVHRVVGKKQDLFLLKGDNTSEIDGFIPKKRILGRLTRVERQGKDIYLGLGPERFLIAFLTRWGIFSPLLISISKIFKSIIKRWSV